MTRHRLLPAVALLAAAALLPAAERTPTPPSDTAIPVTAPTGAGWGLRCAPSRDEERRPTPAAPAADRAGGA